MCVQSKGNDSQAWPPSGVVLKLELPWARDAQRTVGISNTQQLYSVTQTNLAYLTVHIASKKEKKNPTALFSLFCSLSQFKSILKKYILFPNSSLAILTLREMLMLNPGKQMSTFLLNKKSKPLQSPTILLPNVLKY